MLHNDTDETDQNHRPDEHGETDWICQFGPARVWTSVAGSADHAFGSVWERRDIRDQGRLLMNTLRFFI